MSPNGQLEFRIWTWQSDQGGLSRIAYQVLHRGKPVLDTSFMGLLIHNQEPILGENAGLTASRTSDGPGYRELVAEYMQNGSLGRRIDFRNHRLGGRTGAIIAYHTLASNPDNPASSAVGTSGKPANRAVLAIARPRNFPCCTLLT